jgi:hypothetical protein
MDTQKVTAHLPAELLRRAQEMTGKGVTETLKRGLEELTTTEAYRRLRALRGQVQLSINLEELRRDKPRRGTKRRSAR